MASNSMVRSSVGMFYFTPLNLAEGVLLSPILEEFHRPFEFEFQQYTVLRVVLIDGDRRVRCITLPEDLRYSPTRLPQVLGANRGPLHQALLPIVANVWGYTYLVQVSTPLYDIQCNAYRGVHQLFTGDPVICQNLSSRCN